MGIESSDSWDERARSTKFGPALPLHAPRAAPPEANGSDDTLRRPLPTTSVHDASPVLPLPSLRAREESAALRAADGRGGQIGRYVVLRAIGEGGMGVVLAAYDPDLERKVALKILHRGVQGGSAGAVRMRREAQAMARLSHPNVAQVYEVAEDRGRLFLAMEYIEGETLRAWLAAQPRGWRDVLRVYVEAGRGLAAAHAAGLMHRDFKPKTRSPLGHPPFSPSGRILKNRGVSRRGPWRVVPPCAAVLATRWQSSRAVPSAGARLCASALPRPALARTQRADFRFRRAPPGE